MSQLKIQEKSKIIISKMNGIKRRINYFRVPVEGIEGLK